MAICLEYQAVYCSKKARVASLRVQLLAAVVLLSVLVARVTLKIQGTHLGYALAREQKLAVELDMERRELQLQKSMLLRPDSLEKAARGLGLRALDPNQARRVGY